MPNDKISYIDYSKYHACFNSGVYLPDKAAYFGFLRHCLTGYGSFLFLSY
jgi:hypothetical protein